MTMVLLYRVEWHFCVIHVHEKTHDINILAQRMASSEHSLLALQWNALNAFNSAYLSVDHGSGYAHRGGYEWLDCRRPNSSGPREGGSTKPPLHLRRAYASGGVNTSRVRSGPQLRGGEPNSLKMSREQGGVYLMRTMVVVANEQFPVKSPVADTRCYECSRCRFL